MTVGRYKQISPPESPHRAKPPRLAVSSGRLFLRGLIMSKEIRLTRGKVAVVDDEDYEFLSRYKWFAVKSKKGNTYYAIRRFQQNGKDKSMLMHRQIMDADNKGIIKGRRLFIDHKNRNGLDNRKSNLRFCTMSQNIANSRPTRNSSSKFKGVCWHICCGKWYARIMQKRRCIDLGLFENEVDAAKAYNQKAKELFGEFARLNVI